MSYSDVCDRCGLDQETTLHVIRNCPKARVVWLRLVKPSKWGTFFYWCSKGLVL